MMKKKIGRPYLGDKGRVKDLTVRFTKEEYELLKEMAKNENMTISKLIRTSIFEKRGK